ncbi:MAG: RICIN domain-containing protein [Mycobacterium sp.]|nr:RICIN domain-containing protein [Mycobacterium sp.]
MNRLQIGLGRATWGLTVMVFAAVASIALVGAGSAAASGGSAARDGGATPATLQIAGGLEIRNDSSGKCLGILPDNNSPWGKQGDAVQWTCNGNPDQAWHNSGADIGCLIPTLYCQIRNAAGSGQCLSVRAASPADGARVAAGNCLGTSHKDQYWLIASDDSGIYLKNYNSGKLADVFRNGQTDGIAVIQYHDTAGSNQRWFIDAQPV